jgi:hypothetical protein
MTANVGVAVGSSGVSVAVGGIGVGVTVDGAGVGDGDTGVFVGGIGVGGDSTVGVAAATSAADVATGAADCWVQPTRSRLIINKFNMKCQIFWLDIGFISFI